MSRKKLVDAIDIQILNILQMDGRITSKELSTRINLSEPATFQRLRNLINRKIIRSVNAWIDYARFGYNFKALLFIKVIGSKKQWLVDKLTTSGSTTLIVEARKEEYSLTDVVLFYVIVTFKSKQRFQEFAKDLVLNDGNAICAFECHEITEVISEVPAVILKEEI